MNEEIDRITKKILETGKPVNHNGVTLTPEWAHQRVEEMTKEWNQIIGNYHGQDIADLATSFSGWDPLDDDSIQRSIAWGIENR